MDVTLSRVEHLVVHRVGNASREEPLQLSDASSALDDEVSALILGSFLKGLVTPRKKYHFFHETDVALNELCHFARAYFDGSSDLLAFSHAAARHLYARAQHPNISAGDLFVISFVLDGSDGPSRALGLFKSELRDDFLTLETEGSAVAIRHATGVNPRGIDKAALIMEDGTTVYAEDRLGARSKYWQEDFLQVRRQPDASVSGHLLARFADRVASDIADPVEQSRFNEAVRALCGQEAPLTTGRLRETAGRFVEREQVDHALNSAAGPYVFDLDDDATLPSPGLGKKLDRTLSKVSLGHGISMLLPSEFTLRNLRSVSDDGLVLTIQLNRR